MNTRKFASVTGGVVTCGLVAWLFWPSAAAAPDPQIAEAARVIAQPVPAAVADEPDDDARPQRGPGGGDWGQMLDDRVNAFFALPPEERDAHLDEVIDQMQAMREQFEERMRERQEARPDGGEAGERPQRPEGQARGEWRGRGGGGDRQARMDSVNSAKRAEYFAAFRKRAEERGISTSGGPGGRWGR